jgi:hypothetical protein
LRDTGFIIEVDLPTFEQGDELFTRRRALLLMNGTTPYALSEHEGEHTLYLIDKEVLRCGVTVVGGHALPQAREALMEDEFVT